jgi:prevent-host-death family protein
MTTVIAVNEARSQFSKLVQRAAENGERFVVERKGRPVAAIISIKDLERLDHPEENIIESDAQEEKVRWLAKQLGARHQLPKRKQERLSQLIDKQEKEALSAEEKKELHRLLKQCDRVMLKRARTLDEIT